jgi:predicted membrane protein
MFVILFSIFIFHTHTYFPFIILKTLIHGYSREKKEKRVVWFFQETTSEKKKKSVTQLCNSDIYSR